MKNCIDDQSHPDPFGVYGLAVPETTYVLTTDIQLHHVAHFYANPVKFSVLGIDPTFNLGISAVTVTTYCHLMLEHRQTGNPPVMVGPMLACPLLGLKPVLKNFQCLGINCEIAFANGFLYFYICINIKALEASYQSSEFCADVLTFSLMRYLVFKKVLTWT